MKYNYALYEKHECNTVHELGKQKFIPNTAVFDPTIFIGVRNGIIMRHSDNDYVQFNLL